MAADLMVVIRFKDMANSAETREHLEQRCHHLAEEFPETQHYELTLSPDSGEISAHANARGRGVDCVAHASAAELRQAGDRALEKLERELRKVHDKRIFAPRREAQRAQNKRQV